LLTANPYPRLLGHTNVQVLDGGWRKWLAESRPVCTQPEVAVNTTPYVARLDKALWADYDDVKGSLASSQTGSGATLLDVRDLVEWEGHSSSPYGVNFAPRMGRLVGAKHIEWYDFMEPTAHADVHVFKQPEAIRQLLKERAGLATVDPIILYCFKGARAANSLAALKAAGFENVRVYFASWNEWSRVIGAAIDEAKVGAPPPPKDD